jgi:peptidoglycan/LPS O-acetylase OafA/YrhL
MSPAPAADLAPEPTRDAHLDGLRGVAILLVVLYHASFFWLAESPLEIALVLVPAMGLYGVDLFFVLSGFLITGILLRVRGAPGYFRTFYARRTLRIFPAYYATLILFLVVFPLLTPQAEGFWKPGASHETLWYWTYLSNFYVAATGQFQHQFLFVAWSLAIEEQFYLVWPLVVLLASRRALIGICWGMIGTAFVLRCALVYADASPLVPYVLTPCRMDTLAVGALIALLASRPGGLERLARPARWTLPLALGLFAGFVVWWTFGGSGSGTATGMLSGEARLLFYTSQPLVVTVGYSILAAGFGALVILTVVRPGSRLGRSLAWGPLVSIGRYSYGIYLLHRLGIAIARNVVDPGRSEGPFVVLQVLFWGVALALSYGLAWLSWHAIETPFLRLKRFVPYHRPLRPGSGTQ